VSLDFEATGLDLQRDTIISFGLIPIESGRVNLGESRYQLVDPGPVPPAPETIVVHGLRPVDLTGAPSLEAARAALSASLERRFLVAWFATVEAAFLDKLFGGGVNWWLKRTVDVRKLVFDLERLPSGELPGGRDFTLAGTAARYGVPVASPHHALDDALVTAQLFLVTASMMEERGKGTVRALIAESLWEPPVLRRPRAPV
jgi:DNA polymerase-3 subunit epsilon